SLVHPNLAVLLQHPLPDLGVLLAAQELPHALEREPRLDEPVDDLGQHEHREADDVEQRQGRQGLGDVEVIPQQRVRGERRQGHHQRRRAVHGDAERAGDEVMPQPRQLVVAQLHELGAEVLLPRLDLDDPHRAEYLVVERDAVVPRLHQALLDAPEPGRYELGQGDHDYDHHHPGQARRADLTRSRQEELRMGIFEANEREGKKNGADEVHGQPDLEEAVPHRVQVRHEVLYPLRVDAHQVRDLARPAVRVALPEGEHEGLAVYRDDDGGPHPEPDRVALAGRTGEEGEVMPQSEAHYDLTAHDCAPPGGQELTDEGQGESRRQPRAGIPQEVDEAVQNLRPDEEIRVVYELEETGAEEVRPEGPAEGADQRGVPPAASAAFGPAVPPLLPGALPASVPGELPRPLRQEPPVRRLRAAVGREGWAARSSTSSLPALLPASRSGPIQPKVSDDHARDARAAGDGAAAGGGSSARRGRRSECSEPPSTGGGVPGSPSALAIPMDP
ncbi:hypothetical protein THAOC_16424, partial [Thalassiosira oceanica]